MRLSRLLLIPFILCSLKLSAQDSEQFPLGADSLPQAGVPKGELVEYTFEESSIFPGTFREYWVYVPQQYDGTKPACLYVCQDRVMYEAPTVFDNLIHKGEMPVTIGVFIRHGRVQALDQPNSLDRYNRAHEYDGLGDNYARFLIDELLPEVEKKTTSDGRAIRISKDPNDRMIAGNSSGGIAAFTAAWERPDSFRRVFTGVGTYVDQMGGDLYPSLIRKVEHKPLRVFLQDGSNDNNLQGGDWWMANQTMLSAFQFSGYDVNYAFSDGGHNQKHASQVFPDAMRWLWRDWPKPLKANPNDSSRAPIAKLLGPESEWQLVSDGHSFTEGPAVNAQGELFFTDLRTGELFKSNPDRSASVFDKDSGSNGLQFGPDGKLYACANAYQQIVAYETNGSKTIIAEGLGSNDIAISHNGNIYVTDPKAKKVWLISPNGEKRVVDEGIEFPNGVQFSPDQSLLYVSDTRGQFVYSYQIQANGSLAHKQRFYHLRIEDGAIQTSADGMTVDNEGTLYVTTEMGIQFCDQAGRVKGIINRPQNAWLSNVVIGGPNFDQLYATCKDKVYVRSINAKASLSYQAPITPAKPGL